MGFLREQSNRLRRESGWSADDLAEEIFAIFNADVPFEIDSPVVIDNARSPDPGLTIYQTGPSDNAITINRTSPPPFPFPIAPPHPLPGPGTIEITIFWTDGTTNHYGPDDAGDPSFDPANPPKTPESTGGGGFPGKVLSGSGSSYQVEVYENGLDQSPVIRTVRQLQIDEDETIPEGTWDIVGQAGNSFFMQVPVWLPDTEGE